MSTSSCCTNEPTSCVKTNDGTCKLTKKCILTTEEGEFECECICTCKCSTQDCKECVCNCNCTPETAQKIQTADGKVKYRCECTCKC